MSFPRYHIRPDERGHPMAHRVSDTGEIEVEPTGSLMTAFVYAAPVTVSGTTVPEALLHIGWFGIEVERRIVVYGAEWWLELPAPPLLPRDEPLEIEIAGRRARVAARGTLQNWALDTFPFERDDWEKQAGVRMIRRVR